MPRDYSIGATALASLRSKAGLSRDKAAVLLDIAPNTLLRYEHGKNDIGLSIIDNMASLYGVSFEEICNAARKVRNFLTSDSAVSAKKEGNHNE